MDFIKHTKKYFALSGTLLAISLVAIIIWGLPFGLDFKGGAIAEYKVVKELSLNDVESKIRELGIESVLTTRTDSGSYIFKFPPLPSEKKTEILTVVKNFDESAVELRFETVGAAFGPELIKKTIVAVLISALAILLWIGIQFRSFKFGGAAVLAMLHDSFILIGSFAILGHFFSAEVDFLFVTAMLTILSFSVHDTIVVYDRIREIQRKSKGDTMYEIANKAVNETMVRSLNNSFTIVFMLFALVLLGGTTVRWFAVALLVGTVSGTYSSPFVAVPLLVYWENIWSKLRFKRK